jgi:hypothetical protein
VNRSLDIGLDVDGVLYPFSAVISEYASRALGRVCSAEAETFDWYRGWGLTTEEFLDLCGQSALDGVLFTEGDPLPGALEAAEALAAQGHRLHYVTARAIGGISPPMAWNLTAAWLQAWSFPVHSLTVSEDKACRPTDVFLDDGPHIYDALIASGHPRPVLWSHPCTLTHPAERVNTWDEFHTIVDDIGRYDTAPRSLAQPR